MPVTPDPTDLPASYRWHALTFRLEVQARWGRVCDAAVRRSFLPVELACPWRPVAPRTVPSDRFGTTAPSPAA